MNNKKIEIAKNFVELHKKRNLDDWVSFEIYDDDAKYLHIYENLINGVYGNVRTEGLEDLQIEIGYYESHTNSSILFNFELVE